MDDGSAGTIGSVSSGAILLNGAGGGEFHTSSFYIQLPRLPLHTGLNGVKILKLLRGFTDRSPNASFTTDDHPLPADDGGIRT